MAHGIPAEIQQRIQAHIASGEFLTAEEVLREAMDALERRQRGLQHLREMVQEADDDISAGRIGAFDVEETQRAVRQRLSEQGQVD